MKIPSVLNLNNMSTNRTVLNIVSIVVFLNMVGFLVTGRITEVLLFVVLAILTTHFSKNMIFVLGIPAVAVNLFSILPKLREGMETNTAGSDSNTVSDKDRIQNDVAKVKAAQSITKGRQDSKTRQGLSITPLDDEAAATTTSAEVTDESFEVGRAKKRGGGNEIDYASTIEDAYDQLNSVLGSDGIKRLTDDTQKLMSQQMQLAESMKSMGPMIKNLEPMMAQAKGLLEGMSDSNGSGGLGGIMDLAKKFGAGQK